MAILAGEIVAAGRLNRMQPVPYKAAASGNLTMGTSLADVPGATISLTTAAANAVYMASASFDFNITTLFAGQLFEGHLDVDGADQTERALKDTNAVKRATEFQQWRGTLAAAGSHTLKLRGLKSHATPVGSIVTTHTTLHVVIYEVV